ncbi:MAG: hypothetical protein JXC32_21725, partial [Anaerolineae bacterium]|nr:hypothetical protein [Anaerolineae bacterium]
WYACTYALYVGVLMAYSRNLTEPLAFCFAAWGVMLWQQERRAFAAAAFACAGLTKEIALIFPLGLCITTLLDRKFGQAVWAILATFPLLVWELYLGSAFGQLPVMSGPSLERLPLAGILPHLNADPGRLSAFLFAGLPAFAVIPVGLWLLWRHGPSQPAIWWALLHGVFVLLLPLNVYNHIMHAGRNAAGLVMSLVFLLPYLHRWLRLAGLVGALAPTLIWTTPVLRWAPWLSEV